MRVIYWTRKAKSMPGVEQRIRQKFRLGTYKSVNGETPVNRKLSDEELELLKQVEEKGYIQLRNKEL